VTDDIKEAPPLKLDEIPFEVLSAAVAEQRGIENYKIDYLPEWDWNAGPNPDVPSVRIRRGSTGGHTLFLRSDVEARLDSAIRDRVYAWMQGHWGSYKNEFEGIPGTCLKVKSGGGVRLCRADNTLYRIYPSMTALCAARKVRQAVVNAPDGATAWDDLPESLGADAAVAFKNGGWSYKRSGWEITTSDGFVSITSPDPFQLSYSVSLKDFIDHYAKVEEGVEDVALAPQKLTLDDIPYAVLEDVAKGRQPRDALWSSEFRNNNSIHIHKLGTAYDRGLESTMDAVRAYLDEGSPVPFEDAEPAFTLGDVPAGPLQHALNYFGGTEDGYACRYDAGVVAVTKAGQTLRYPVAVVQEELLRRHVSVGFAYLSDVPYALLSDAYHGKGLNAEGDWRTSVVTKHASPFYRFIRRGREVVAATSSELGKELTRRDQGTQQEVLVKDKTDPDKETQTIVKTLQADATDAAWRTAGSQFVKLTREPLVALLSRHLGPEDPAFRARVATFLETEIGTALLASLLSAGLAAMPAVAGEVPQRLSRELRVRAMADAGDVVAEVLMGPLRQVMVLYLRDMPEAAAAAPALLAAGKTAEPAWKAAEREKEPAR